MLTRRQLVAAAAAMPALDLLPITDPTARAATISIQRLAWAGIRLEFGNVALFIDAIAPDASNGLKGPSLESNLKRRFAIVTHHHDDHCSPASLIHILGEDGFLLAYEESARFIDNRTIKVQPTRLHEPNLISRGNGEFVARCAPASDGLGSPQVSWVIDAGGKRIIHCGDTQWHGGFWNIARAYGPFDVAFLPINGFRQTDGLFVSVEQPMSLTPEQAALVAHILKARLTIPIHYGNADEATYVEEPRAIERFSKEMTRRSLQYRVVEPGNLLEI